MNLSDVFTVNCKATSSLISTENRLSFKDLTSGINNQNKNGTIARFSFDDFFIDLYFIENGPLAYAPNTIWISVGFWAVSSLPFSVYDILAFSKTKNFKCFTYSYLYTKDILIEAFGEINDCFKNILLPLLNDISSDGTKKNSLINSQKEFINSFVEDNIFQDELEIFEATARIRDLLIRNFTETNISRVTIGGISEFFKGNTQKAVKKLQKTKKKTAYENMLLESLKNNELNGFDASPFRAEYYKNYNSSIKKKAVKFTSGLFFKAFLGTLLFMPLGLALTILIFGLFTLLLFRGSLVITFSPVLTSSFLFMTAFVFSEILYLNLFTKIKAILLKNKKSSNKKTNLKLEFPKRKSKFFIIIYELIIILFIFFSINSTTVFYEDCIKHPDESKQFFALSQETSDYNYIKSVKSENLFKSNSIDFNVYVMNTKNETEISFVTFTEAQNELVKKALSDNTVN